MAGRNQNRLAAQLLKAEMLGDDEAVKKLRAELEESGVKDNQQNNQSQVTDQYYGSKLPQNEKGYNKKVAPRKPLDNRVKKFVQSTGSLSQMFAEEKSSTTSDDVRLYLKTAGKFSRDDMNTKYFSEEIDDSQAILNRSKKHKSDPFTSDRGSLYCDPSHLREDQQTCSRCAEKQPMYMTVDKSSDFVYMSLTPVKLQFDTLNHVVIRNNDHSCDSFVSSSENHQVDTERLIDTMSGLWKSKGFRCVITELHLKSQRSCRDSYTSCSNHFQIQCIPVKEKNYERLRMSFKQSLEGGDDESSLNKRLLRTDGHRRIQRYLPKGLSYFWVCFDDLKNGFAHVIESDEKFSRTFAFEVISGILGKEFNKATMGVTYSKQSELFERFRDFKLMYTEYNSKKSNNQLSDET